MRIVFLSRGGANRGVTPLRPQPVADEGYWTLDGGGAETNYVESYDNGAANNPLPEVSLDFGRSI